MSLPISSAEGSDIPPIVLLVEDDLDTREMYAAYFESEGVWMASAARPEEALATIDELRPDVIVTDLGFPNRALLDGPSFVHALRSRSTTSDTPLIVLTGTDVEALSEQTRTDASMCLRKPVLPDILLGTIRGLLQKSRHLRARSERARARTSELASRSERLLEKSHSITQQVSMDTARPCPSCGGMLEWIERGSLGDAEYDYYRWCDGGCGLYCFDRQAVRWVKLA